MGGWVGGWVPLGGVGGVGGGGGLAVHHLRPVAYIVRD